MRVLILSEVPWVPSSLGKVTSLIASGLINRGYRVCVANYSGYTASSWAGYIDIFNPRRRATVSGEPYAEYLPDAEIPIVYWGKSYDFSTALEKVKAVLGGDPDVVFAYLYPYIEIAVNDIVFKFFTSRRVPAVLYAIHEGPYMDPQQSLSTLAYTIVLSPSSDVALQYIRGLTYYASRSGLTVPLERFSVLPHPVLTDLYREISRRIPPPETPVIGMFAKNHIRKDYLTLLETVFRVRRETGVDVKAGLFWIDALGGYWNVDNLVGMISHKYGVPREEVLSMVTFFHRELSAIGIPETSLFTMLKRSLSLHLYLTRGEAFGLPPVETVLLGIPTISSDIPPQREIFGEDIPLVKTEIRSFDSVYLYQPDLDDAVEKTIKCLEKNCNPPTSLIERLNTQLSTENIIDTLNNIFEKALEDPRPLGEILPLLTSST